MLDIKFVRNNPARVQAALKARGAQADLTDSFLEYDRRRKDLLAKTESLRHQRNVASDNIAALKKSGENADGEVAAMRSVSAQIKELDQELSETESRISELMLQVPNIPDESVPVGRDEADNTIVKEAGQLPEFDFTPAAHWDLGEALGILDFSRAAKIAGARFPLYVGAGALMERALINFMLDIHTGQHGYTECLPPFIVNRKTMTGTGQLPKFEDDLFKLEKWDYFLIPTAEVPLTNLYQEEILAAEDLPLKYTAYTPCFRSEAGSHGKDTRGLIRQHQFNKVELVKFARPETAFAELESLLADAEGVLERLDLPYRVVTLCTGDLGFSAVKTYDIEVWFPAQGRYREISSCSNFSDFQARRAGIRFKESGQKGTRFVHTLNGSGLAVGRTLAALLENYQEKDGSVTIPAPLRPYMRNLVSLTP